MRVPYDKLKERYKPQMLYYVNTGRLTYIARCSIQCGLDTLLNQPFKSILDNGNINRARAVLTLVGFQSAISRVKIWNSYSVCPSEIP
jgi:hypothetical protein